MKKTSLALLAFVMSACAGLVAEPSPTRQAYLDHLERWRDQAWVNYDMVYQRRCYCLPQHSRPLRLQVRNGVISQARYADDGARLDDGVEHDLKTVSDWFEVIEAASRYPAASLDVDYDAAFGFPREIDIDYDKRIADDEQSVTIFEVIRR